MAARGALVFVFAWACIAAASCGPSPSTRAAGEGSPAAARAGVDAGSERPDAGSADGGSDALDASSKRSLKPAWATGPERPTEARAIRREARPVVDIRYPRVLVQRAPLQAKLDEAMEAPLRAMADEFVKAYAYQAKLTYLAGDGGAPLRGEDVIGEHRLMVACLAGLATARVVSVGCSVTKSIGPPHPLYSHRSMTFVMDEDSLREIALDDLLPRGAARSVLIERATPRLVEAGATMIGRSDLPDMFGDFYLTRDAIVVSFRAGDLGPWSRGVLQASVPYGELAGVLAPDL